MQTEEKSDGPASTPIDTGLVCLLTLARFFGVPADGDQLRHRFAESGNTLSETDLLRAAKHIGLKAGLLEPDWRRLKDTPLPAMARQKDGRYLVLAKVEAEKVLVQDPFEGRASVLSRVEFESIWAGRLILVTKRAALRMPDMTCDFTWFIPAIVKYRRPLGEVVLASFFLQLFALLTPLFTQVAIDKVLVHKAPASAAGRRSVAREFFVQPVGARKHRAHRPRYLHESGDRRASAGRCARFHCGCSTVTTHRSANMPVPCPEASDSALRSRVH